MKSKRLKATNNFSWIIIVALLIALYSSYFLLYIPKQEGLVKERGFRILEKYAENIHNKNSYYKTHFKNYGVFYVLKDKKDSIRNAFKTGWSTQDSTQILMVINDLEKELVLNMDSIQHDISYNKEEICVEYKIDSLKFENNSFELNDTLLEQYYSVEVPITKLMENLKFDQLFENIALLDSNKTIYNSNGSVIKDISSFDKIKEDTLLRSQGGVLQELEIQGVKTHVFILPIEFLKQEFFIAGFISDKNFKQKTRTINSQSLSIFSGILLLLLIGMPILKIVFIGRKERLNVRDAHFATISMIIGISLLTLLFIGSMKYYIVDASNSRGRIENLSSQLAGNIENDFQEINCLVDSVISGKTGFGKMIQDTLAEQDVKYKRIAETLYQNQFPFNEILLIDSLGKAKKAATTTPFSNLVTLDLADRNYYKNLTKKLNLGWPRKNDSTKNTEAFFIESIKSYNTGNQETAFSFKMNKCRANSFGANYLVVTSKVPSLYDQVLPPDVAFVVINKKGEVQFHSVQSKNLQENFLVESNYHPRLQGALKYRTSETMRISYNEQQWLARIVPIEDVPLFHITLVDLKYADRKNSRSYLFTFYFMLFTFLCIVVGMQVIQRFDAQKRFLETKTWSFEWLIYDKKSGRKYRMLLIVFSLILLFQTMGLIIISQPYAMLLYQLIFIAFSGFTAFIVLKNDGTKLSLPSKIIVGVMFVMALALSILSIVGLVVSILIALFTFFQIKKLRQQRVNIRQTRYLDTRRSYLVFMFIWLIILGVIPTVSYFYTVKTQENALAKTDAMIHVAHENLKLIKHKGKGNQDINRVNQKFDNLEMTLLDSSVTISDSCFGKDICLFTFLDCVSVKLDSSFFQGRNLNSLYASLPSPITKDDYLMALTKSNNELGEWCVKNNWMNAKSSIYYSAPSFSQIIKVSASQNWWHRIGKALKMLLFMLLPFVVLAFFVYYTFKFLANLVLGTIVADWKNPSTPSWQKISENKAIDRLLLIVFEGSNYYKEFKQKQKVEQFDARELFYSDTTAVMRKLKWNKVVWIKGIGDFLQDYKNSQRFIPILQEINELKNKRVVFEMPYDMDFITEYFDNYISEYQLTDEEEISIHNYLKELQNIFKNFYRYTGSINTEAIKEKLDQLQSDQKCDKIKDPDCEAETLANAHLMKLQYSYIWNNISRMEKMILFDLADDGMLNFKNRFLINRLQSKGLITLTSHPEIFNSSFQYFLKYSINPEETLELEQKLSRQGNWKNTKYLLLLLLIPLVAFVVISQGTSIEKVIGILTGVIAIFSGAMRLMDTSWFMSLSKS